MNERKFIRYIVEDVENGKIGHYKKTDTKFTYLTNKNFKQLKETCKQENTDIPVICGNVVLKPCDLQKIDDSRRVNGNLVESTAAIEQQEFDTVVFEKELPDATAYTRRNVRVVGLETKLCYDKKFTWYTKGYLNVEENTYVRYCRSWIPILILILGLCFCGILGYSGYKIYEKNNTPTKYVETDPNYEDDQYIWEGDLPKSGKDSVASEDTTTFPGYGVVVINKETPTVDLVNPIVNTVDFTYTLCDTEGKELYTTSKIRPGKYVPFAIGKLYNIVGSYQLSLIINTYDINTGEECVSVTIPITLEVTENL